MLVLHHHLLLQNPINSPPPQWLQSSLESFHFVVLEEPIYWLVALSARACLYDLLSGVQVRTGSGSELVYQDWSEESLKEVVWTQRYLSAIRTSSVMVLLHTGPFRGCNISQYSITSSSLAKFTMTKLLKIIHRC